MAPSPYKNTGRHPVDLDDGRVLEPGQIADVEVGVKFPLAKHLADTGQLTKVRPAKDDDAPEATSSTSTAQTASSTQTKEQSR